MPAHLFDEILAKGVRSGQIPAREQTSRDWFRKTASSFGRVSESQLLKGGSERLRTNISIGSMYMYTYDAKHKKTLPYFDRFPLVFPFKKVSGGFMGINLHYLPLTYRAKLMDGLYSISNNNRYNETTKIGMTYNILNGSSKFRYFKPCVKKYLTTQLRSKFLYVYPSEWDIALFLPLERFEGAGKSKVYADSRNIIRGG
jgi:hypothetical protein